MHVLRMVGRTLRRRPAVLAIGGYIVVAGVVLMPAMRPDRTVVPADILSNIEPWHSIAGGTRDHNPIVSDAAFQFAPWWQFVSRELHAGRVPEWNPEILGGVPVTPNGYVSVQYPPFWLVRVVSVFDAYDMFVLVHLALGAIGVYALSRVVGARPTSAWLAGLGTMAGGMWVHWSLHLVHLVGMTWLPLVLAAALQVVMRPRWLTVSGLAIAFGAWWSGANPQYALYGTLAVGGVVLGALVARALRDRAKAAVSAVAVGAALVLGALLAAPALLPTVARSHSIVREREPLGAINLTHLPGRDRILAVLPEAAGSSPDHVTVPEETVGLDTPFIGVVGLVLACASLFSRRKSRNIVLLFLATAVVIVLGTTAQLHPQLYALVPGYDRFRVSSRWLSVLPAVALPLAAVAWDRLRAGDMLTRVGLLIATAASGVATLVWYSNHHRLTAFPVRFFHTRMALTGALLAALFVAGALARRLPRTMTTVVVMLSLSEVAFHAIRWYPAVRKTAAYPTTVQAEIARSRGGRLVRFAPTHQPLPGYTPDVPLFDRVTEAQGQAVLFPRNVDRYLRIVDDYGRYAIDQNTAPALVKPAELSSPLLDALDVRTILVDDRTDVPAAYPKLAAGPPAVYARTSPGPALLVPNADGLTNREMWRRVADPTWQPATTAAVVGLSRPVRGGPGSVRSGPAASDRDEWLVDAPRGGFLRVSAAYAPGWSATVDGHSVKVLLADGMFRGVTIQPGRHDVRFRYRNTAERSGVALAGVASVVLLAGFGISRLRSAGNSSEHEELLAEQTPSDGEP